MKDGRQQSLGNYLFTLEWLCLRDVLNNAMFDNFMLFNVAFTILLSTDLCVSFCDYAGTLLQHFVRNVGSLYGKEMLTYNMHGLTNLAACATRYGPLDNASAFPFENYLGQIKKSVKKPAYVVQQVVNNVSQKQRNRTIKHKLVSDYPILKREHYKGPLTQCIMGNNTRLHGRDSYFGLRTGEVICVKTLFNLTLVLVLCIVNLL